jgi:hypothetical protein
MIPALSAVDISSIPAEAFPLVVLSDHRVHPLSRAIRAHTDGDYSHAMLMISPGVFATQGFRLFERSPVYKWLRGPYRLKFWTCDTWPAEDRDRAVRATEALLALPEKRRRYDWRGILGHFFGHRGFQNPRRFYCSEHVGAVLRDLCGVRFDLKQPTPAEINAWCKTEDSGMRLLGVYDRDLLSSKT